MAEGYELFDHTADMGLRAWAATPSDLVAPLTQALYAAIGDIATEGGGSDATLTLDGREASLLLRDYLARLVLMFECEAAVLRDPTTRVFDQNHLSVSGRRVAVNTAASVFAREVKAVTYHDLALRRTAAGWEFTVIVDI